MDGDFVDLVRYRVSVSCLEDGKLPPPSLPVSGKITLDGKPLTTGKIRFHHTKKVHFIEQGIIHKGTHQARLPVGSYHVLIYKSEPEVPEKYRTVRSGLMIEVKEGENRFDFELEDGKLPASSDQESEEQPK